MLFLAIDVGSSSVKARLFRNGVAVGALSHTAYPTLHDGVKVEVEADTLLNAVAAAIGQIPSAPKADAIGLSVMSPAWVAMDKRGHAITPVITHQDRRAIEIARDLERRVGRRRHLALAGNRPFPGGISSTTCAWFLKHQKGAMARADLVGHLNTLLHRHLTGQRVIDPSNASFTGLYLTCTLGGWSDELCDAVGVSKSLLPEVVQANVVAGRVTNEAAARFGLKSGQPVLAGMVDTSAAMLLTGAADGQLFHSCGSTDVLGVVCSRPRPNEKLLTRALGVGKKWMSVATLAAAGSALDWMHGEFFRDLSDGKFYKLAMSGRKTSVRFEPYLAGERTSVEQKQGSFSGLTLATTREDLLAAMVESLCTVSSARLGLLAQAQPRFRPTVFASGGGGALAKLMHRDWPRRFRYRFVREASLHGLAAPLTNASKFR
jgi:xylulokinase